MTPEPDASRGERARNRKAPFAGAFRVELLAECRLKVGEHLVD